MCKIRWVIQAERLKLLRRINGHARNEKPINTIQNAFDPQLQLSKKNHELVDRLIEITKTRQTDIQTERQRQRDREKIKQQEKDRREHL